MTKRPKIIPKSDWGEALHTALRKLCDSTATTIAYNAIAVMEESWHHYVEHVRNTLRKDDVLHEELRRVSLQWNCHQPSFMGKERHLANILACSFKLFSIADWQGFAGFLEQ